MPGGGEQRAHWAVTPAKGRQQVIWANAGSEANYVRRGTLEGFPHSWMGKIHISELSNLGRTLSVRATSGSALVSVAILHRWLLQRVGGWLLALASPPPTPNNNKNICSFSKLHSPSSVRLQKLKSSMETSRAHSTTPITQTPIFLLTCVLIQLRMLVNWLFFIILILLQALIEHKEVLSAGKQLRTHEYQ